ncbi:MAG: YceI family protein [Chitinophagales bacterium]|nr:YceI family protein [Bacteroidota bacterium]
MKTRIVSFILGLFVIGLSLQAQNRVFTREGNINFFSKTSMENIEANNHKVAAVIDLTTGNMEFNVLMKAFEFEKALMQEHFNENYVESDQFPKASFKGKIHNIETLSLTQDGEYPVKVSGSLTIHGVTKEMVAPAVLIVKGGKVTNATSKFDVTIADYDIEIPSLVRDNIAEKVAVSVDLALQSLE